MSSLVWDGRLGIPWQRMRWKMDGHDSPLLLAPKVPLPLCPNLQPPASLNSETRLAIVPLLAYRQHHIPDALAATNPSQPQPTICYQQPSSQTEMNHQAMLKS